jgi:hypothetical protein
LSDTPPEPSNPNKKKRSAEVCANWVWRFFHPLT